MSLTKGKKKRPKTEKPSQQHKRFVEAAKELGCDESAEQFEKNLKRLAPKPSKK